MTLTRVPKYGRSSWRLQSCGDHLGNKGWLLLVQMSDHIKTISRRFSSAYRCVIAEDSQKDNDYLRPFLKPIDLAGLTFDWGELLSTPVAKEKTALAMSWSYQSIKSSMWKWNYTNKPDKTIHLFKKCWKIDPRTKLYRVFLPHQRHMETRRQYEDPQLPIQIFNMVLSAYNKSSQPQETIALAFQLINSNSTKIDTSQLRYNHLTLQILFSAFLQVEAYQKLIELYQKIVKEDPKAVNCIVSALYCTALINTNRIDLAMESFNSIPRTSNVAKRIVINHLFNYRQVKLALNLYYKSPLLTTGLIKGLMYADQPDLAFQLVRSSTTFLSPTLIGDLLLGAINNYRWDLVNYALDHFVDHSQPILTANSNYLLERLINLSLSYKAKQSHKSTLTKSQMAIDLIDRLYKTTHEISVEPSILQLHQLISKNTTSTALPPDELLNNIMVQLVNQPHMAKLLKTQVIYTILLDRVLSIEQKNSNRNTVTKCLNIINHYMKCHHISPNHTYYNRLLHRLLTNNIECHIEYAQSIWYMLHQSPRTMVSPNLYATYITCLIQSPHFLCGLQCYYYMRTQLGYGPILLIAIKLIHLINRISYTNSKYDQYYDWLLRDCKANLTHDELTSFNLILLDFKGPPAIK